jgi:uncharacterized protein YndB with AHSA1/START domain
VTDLTRASARPLGTLHFVDGRGTVRMEDTYDTDIDDLWSALVDPSRLARWIADVTGDLSVGGGFRVSFTSGWDGTGRVEVCDAPQRLLVKLDPNGVDDVNEMTIEASLSREGNKTRLVIEDSGFERDELAGHGAGWQAHFEDLATYLAGGEPSGWGDRWRQWTPVYTEMADRLN